MGRRGALRARCALHGRGQERLPHPERAPEGGLRPRRGAGRDRPRALHRHSRVDLSVFGNFQNDITQMPGSPDNRAYMYGAAANIQRGGFGLRGLVSHWNINGPMVYNGGRDVSSQWGFYVEPSYTIPLGDEAKVGVFGRWNRYDYAKGLVNQFDAGVNFWPIDNVVFKADYSHIDKEGARAEDVLNFGIGYSF